MAEQEEVKEDSLDDLAEYSPKSEFSKPTIVFNASQKCVESRAKELNPGFFNTVMSKDGLPIKTWVPDERRIYCNSVKALMNLLVPEIITDEHKFVNVKDFLKKCKDLFEKYACPIYDITKGPGGTSIVKNLNKKYMPEPDKIVVIVIEHELNSNVSGSVERVAGGWNENINSYWDELVGIHDELFYSLMKIIHGLNYFKQKVRW